MKLTKEQQAQFGRLLSIWRTDIAAFALDVFGVELRPKQIEFAEAFRKNSLVTFKGGVGFGKTTVMAIIVWWSLFCHDDVKVTIFGPTDSQLENGIWNELNILYDKMDKFLRDQWEVQSEKIERKTNPSTCYARRRVINKDNPSSISGIHAANNFFLVDEASGVPDEAFDLALQNHLDSDPNPKLILVSNPKYRSGFFYRTWEDHSISDDWVKVHGKMTDNPNVTPERLAQAERRYGGKGSNGYIINVLGEFPDSDEEGLIPAWHVNVAVDNAEAIPSPSRPIFWGVDPAGPGKDRTIILKRQDNKVLEMPVERQGFTITQLSYLIRDMWRALPHDERERTIIAVDANGLGRGLAANLRDFGMRVHAVTTQSSPTKGRDAQGREQFAKLRDQLWWEAREWFATENVSIPNCDPLIKELKSISWAFDGAGRTKVEGKLEMKKRLKMSPDYADALCLTFAVDETRYFGKYSWSQPLAPRDLRWAE
jgi:hypothetical protein